LARAARLRFTGNGLYHAGGEALMARIRSIHPGIFTDEAFASLSMAARVLLLGIWTEADDHGVFEWKPVTLKMRIMPVDSVSIPELLAEIEAAGVIKAFSSGKSYGLVRNFCRYQKPKKPNFVHPIPPEFYTYAGLNEDGSLPVTHRSGTGSEKSQQREEGGGKKEDGKGEGEGAKPARAKGDASLLRRDFEPSVATRDAIGKLGFGETQYAAELAKFFTYYAARGYERADWDAALISWFQRAKPDPSQEPRPPAATAMVGKVFVIEGTLEWNCWQRHMLETRGKGSAVTDASDGNRMQRGWWFVTKFPPGYDEATGEKLAPKNDEAAA
jgi:hypothetical protein